MDSILIAVITAGAIAFCGLLIQRMSNEYLRHKKHHIQLDDYPRVFEKHGEDHKQITTSLALVQRGNVSQIRAQLVSIHERAMLEGMLSTHWRATFYELYEDYKALGGNGFIEILKKEIDDL